MNPFTARVIRIIKAIPSGRVMSYGQVAASAGNPRGARQISRILHSMSRKHELPWHRIINAQGGISTTENAEEKGFTQRDLLEQEGVLFNSQNKVDLAVYRWFPSDTDDEFL